jgi:hypothetical protein
MHCESNERRTNQKLREPLNGRLWMNTLGWTLQIRDLYSLEWDLTIKRPIQPREGPYK